MDDLLLWKYVDGLCNAQEQEMVEQYLLENPSQTEKLAQMQSLDSLMGQQEMEVPSMRFVQNVVEKAEAINTGFNDPLMPRVWKYLGGFAVAAFSLLVAYNFGVSSFEPINSLADKYAVWSEMPSVSEGFSSQLTTLFFAVLSSGFLYLFLELLLNKKQATS